MFPLSAPLLGKQGFVSARLVRSQSYSGTSPTLASLGAQAGDMVVVIAQASGPTAPGTWTGVAVGGSGAGISWRQITSGDLASGVNAGTSLSIYRGAVSLTQVASSSSGTVGTPVTAAGFARNGKHAGLIGFTRTTGDGFNTPGISSPTAWVSRGQSIYYWGAAAPANATGVNLQDRLTPPNDIYSGQNIVSGGPAGAGATSYSAIFELRTA